MFNSAHGWCKVEKRHTMVIEASFYLISYKTVIWEKKLWLIWIPKDIILLCGKDLKYLLTTTLISHLGQFYLVQSRWWNCRLPKNWQNDLQPSTRWKNMLKIVICSTHRLLMRLSNLQSNHGHNSRLESGEHREWQQLGRTRGPQKQIQSRLR